MLRVEGQHGKAGEEQRVTISVPRDVLAYWDVRVHDFLVEGGTYRIDVGASSRDIRLHADVEVKGDEISVPLTTNSTIAEVVSVPSGKDALTELVKSSFPDVTEAEQAVLTLLCEGYSNAEIAERVKPATADDDNDGATRTGTDTDHAAASARAEREAAWQAEQHAAAEQRARLESDMTAAAKHLRDYLLAPDVDTHLLLSEALATDEDGERIFHGLSIFDGRDAWTSTSTVLDLDPDLDHDDRDAAVSEALVGLGPDRAAVALWLLRANPWPGDGYEHLIYVDALNRAGHAWTDLEREHHGLDENGNLPTPDTDEDGDQ